MKNVAIAKKWMTIIGCVGFGLILLTFGVYAATSIFSLYVKIPLGIGVVFVLVFWILSTLTSRAARYGSNVAVMILLAFSILILVNFVSARNSGRIDTTTGKQFSLSEQTKKILAGLNQDINITAFYSERHYRRGFAEDTLNEYQQQSSRVHLTFLDPYLKPDQANIYKIRWDGAVVFESGEKREYVESYENEEQDFTGAILKLLATEQKKLYFLEGHGEHDIDGYGDGSYSGLKSKIEADNYLVETLILGERVPADCNVLVIAGPQNALLPQEEEIIIKYLDEGGKAIIMVDPPPAPSLANIVERWGVEGRDDIILDPVQQVSGILSIPATLRYDESHTITIPLAMGRIMTFFPIARSLMPGEDSDANFHVTQLVKTSDGSWGESNTEALRYTRGPVCVAIAVALKEKSEDEAPITPDQPPDETKERRVLVVIGDSDFVANQWLEAGNPDLFMNSVNWLTEEEELISIRPKDQGQTRVKMLTGQQLRLMMYTSVFAIPIVLLIAGGIVWWRRR